MNSKDTAYCRRSISTGIVITCVALVASAVALWPIYVGIKSYQLYARVIGLVDGLRGDLHRADISLGHTTKPSSSGQFVFETLPPVDIRIDGEGFRVPVVPVAPPPSTNGTVVFLGCSHTFGIPNRSEDTFPFLVGQELEMRSINAGVSGFGLAQMLIRGADVIAKYRPDYVVVQYSRWLLVRSMNRISVTNKLWLQPVPYFAEADDGSIYVAPPVYYNFGSDIELFQYAGAKANDFRSFYANVGWPLIWRQDLSHALYLVRDLLGKVPNLATDAEKVTEFAYRQFQEMSESVGAKLLVVGLRSGAPLRMPALDPGVISVNGQAALLNALRPSEDYREAYHSLRGNPPTPSDSHPNARAHRIIASEIAQAIRAWRHVEKFQAESQENLKSSS